MSSILLNRVDSEVPDQSPPPAFSPYPCVTIPHDVYDAVDRFAGVEQFVYRDMTGLSVLPRDRGKHDPLLLCLGLSGLRSLRLKRWRIVVFNFFSHDLIRLSCKVVEKNSLSHPLHSGDGDGRLPAEKLPHSSADQSPNIILVLQE